MSLAALSTEVVVWFVSGVPARLVWDGVRYRITDTPTPLTEDVWSPPMTHAASRIVGWRFQGTTANGRSLMFEIAEGDTAWHVLRVYD
ncbi:MAG TPA: hypothetical protein VIL55_03980 [Naasia sp.]|jgi:hypothetical protein